MKGTKSESEKDAGRHSTHLQNGPSEPAEPNAPTGAVGTLHRALGNQGVQMAAKNDSQERTPEESAHDETAEPIDGRAVVRARLSDQPRPPAPTADMCPRCADRHRAGRALNCSECEERLNEAESAFRQQSLTPPALQPKLMVATPTDEFEREADRVAEAVMGAPARASTDGLDDDSPSSESPRGREDGTPTVALSPAPGGQELIEGRGRPLSRPLRTYFEPRLGTDLGEVRMHTGPRADSATRAVNARAFTYGHDVLFRSGEYRPATRSGKRLIAHELAHVLQQSASTLESISPVPGPRVQRQEAEPDPSTFCYREGQDPESAAGACRARRPADCPTYGQWLNRFTRLATFEARDTAPEGEQESEFTVIGKRAVRPIDEVEEAEGEGEAEEHEPVPMVRERTRDRFVDHPTDQWVRTCLPDNLRTTAYQLPADCADMAVILRHVWLAAHGRTESYPGSQSGRRWNVGHLAGRAVQGRIEDIIVEELYSRNVAQMVSPYTGGNGTPIRSFEELQPRLHPGDILVWEHQKETEDGWERTGGHTHTVIDVERSGDRVRRLDLAQGNLPVFAEQAEEIRSHIGESAPSESNLRKAPGRRIETNTMSFASSPDEPLPGSDSNREVWTIDDAEPEGEPERKTRLVAAGPPAAARRPPAGREDGEEDRTIADWHGRVRNASPRELPGILEAALRETRAAIEGGRDDVADDAVTVGRLAGERLWALAESRDDIDYGAYDRSFRQLRGLIRGLGEPDRDPAYTADPTPRASEVGEVFERIDAAFAPAARGTTSFDGRDDDAEGGPALAAWMPRIQGASLRELPGMVEATFHEVKAALEAGETDVEPTALRLAHEAGQRLWTLATSEDGLGNLSHYRPLRRIRAIIDELGGSAPDGASAPDPSSSAAVVADVFDRIDHTFKLAARGASDITFERDQPTYNVLVTGFDPFTTAMDDVPAGTVNPSAAAALALDGETIHEGDVEVAVESVVLPVDYDQFRGGMVEGIVRPLVEREEVDAVITTSLDPNIGPGDPLEIERYAVGIHRKAGEFETIVPSTVLTYSLKTGFGPAIFESPDETRTIEAGLESDDDGSRVRIDPEVVLRFGSEAIADRAISRLGVPEDAKDSDDEASVTISDPDALAEILETMAWENDRSPMPPGLAPFRTETDPRIVFEVGGEEFTARVIQGPGGSFLSNEVSYRVLRLLHHRGETDIPSFHVHLPTPLEEGSRIPQHVGEREQRRGEASQAIEDQILSTLQELLAVVGDRSQ